MPTSVRFIDDPASGGGEPPAGAAGRTEPPGRGGELADVPRGGGVEPVGATPMSVFFIASAGDGAALVDG